MENARNKGLFFTELNQESPLPLDFNDNSFQTVEVHKYLSVSVGKKLDFNIHIDNKINKCDKITVTMKLLPLGILHDSLLNIYKTFVYLHLDYTGI